MSRIDLKHLTPLAAALLAALSSPALAEYVLRSAPQFSGEAAPAQAAPAEFALSVSSLYLGTAAPNTSAPVQTVTLANVGGQAGPFTLDATALAPFSLSHDCPASLGAAAQCTLTLGFAPTVAGSFAVTPVIAGLPLALTGVSNLGQTGEWSTVGASTTAPTTANLNFGTKTVGAVATTKSMFMRNVGTGGQLSAGFTLNGDTAHFKIKAAYRTNTTGTLYGCDAGGAVAADKLSVTPCLAGLVGWSTPHVLLQLDYAPTASGSHSVVVTPTTSNGSALPGALTFTGAGAFNPTAAWSSNYTTLVAPTTSTLAFGSRSVGSTLTKDVYLRNTGTHGPLRTGVVLTGDTTHFQIKYLYRTDNSNNGYGCNAGGSVALNKLSVTPCESGDPSGSSTPHLKLGITYAPTAPGSHSITITPTTDNGTALPSAVTMTGTGL